MELHLALKEIVEKEGSSILTEPLLVNMLADYNAFEKCQAYKFVIKFLIENGITKDIRDLDTKQNNIDLYQNNISTKVCESFGFEKTIVSYIIVSIGMFYKLTY